MTRAVSSEPLQLSVDDIELPNLAAKRSTAAEAATPAQPAAPRTEPSSAPPIAATGGALSARAALLESGAVDDFDVPAFLASLPAAPEELDVPSFLAQRSTGPGLGGQSAGAGSGSICVEDDPQQPDWRFTLVSAGQVVGEAFFDADQGWERSDRPRGWTLRLPPAGSWDDSPMEVPLAPEGRALRWAARQEAVEEAVRMVASHRAA